MCLENVGGSRRHPPDPTASAARRSAIRRVGIPVLAPLSHAPPGERPVVQVGEAPRPARRPRGEARGVENIGDIRATSNDDLAGCIAGRMPPHLHYGLLDWPAVPTPSTKRRAAPAGAPAPAAPQDTIVPAHDQLDRILRSGAFQQADRLKRFLTFIVRETVAGRGTELKEYV